MANTRDLESQAENDRSEIKATLDELRSRMSTGQIVDQALAYARGHGGSEFVRNFGSQVKTNPLPVALVAAGLGWLIAGQRRPAAARSYSPSIVPSDEAYYDNRYADKARETSGEVAGALRDSAGALRDSAYGAADRARGAFDAARDSVEDASTSASDALASARDRAEGVAASARDSVSSAYGAAAGAVGRATSAVGDTAAAIGRRAHDMRDLASDVGRGTAERARQAGHGIAEQAGRAQNAFSQLIREQPLVAGAIGLAIGAIIGASLPRSRREDELMGEASESVKATAKGAAREQFEHIEDAGGRIVEKVRGAAEEQGLSADSAQSLVRDIGAKVSAVAAAAKEGAEGELKSAKEKAEGEMTAAAEKMGSSHDKDDWSPAHADDAHVHEAAGPERFSEADPHELPAGTGNPPGPNRKTAERVG